MPELIDEITVINRALARFGGGAIQDREEDSDLARQCFAIFDDTLEFFLASWNWNWARETRQLERLAETPINGWTYAYAIPSGVIGGPERLLRSKRQDDILRDYGMENRKIYCDRDSLWGAFVFRRSMDLWPADVRTAFTVFLASELCVPVGHDDDLAAKLRAVAVGSPQEKMSGGMIGRCADNDAIRAGPKTGVLDSEPLTGSRYGGGGPLSGPWWG